MGISSAGNTCRKKGHEKGLARASTEHRPGAPGTGRQQREGGMGKISLQARAETDIRHKPGVVRGKHSQRGGESQKNPGREFPLEICGVGITGVGSGSAKMGASPMRELNLKGRRK